MKNQLTSAIISPVIVSTYLCVNQSPAAFMMILADLKAKYEFIHSGVDSKIEKLKIGGMVHGHMPGTYYFLASDYHNRLK